jgi:hypothetical protein
MLLVAMNRMLLASIRHGQPNSARTFACVSSINSASHLFCDCIVFAVQQRQYQSKQNKP